MADYGMLVDNHTVRFERLLPVPLSASGNI